MRQDLEAKYRDYEMWLKERHFDDGTWVLNWDLHQNQFAEFGKGDSLFYTGIFLTALAIEKNEEEFTALLQALNQQKFARGMYPRYRDTFNTSKDQYCPLMVALVYGSLAFPHNSVIEETIKEIIAAVRENNYHLKNPDGSNTTFGDMRDFRPIFTCIEGRFCLRYFLVLGEFPIFSFLLNLFRLNYFNNFMYGCHYLIYQACKEGAVERTLLRLSVKLFASINKRNPYFLMIRDLICGSKKHQSQVEQILEIFPETHLPNDLDVITHSDMLWQRDPRDWAKPKQELILLNLAPLFFPLPPFFLSVGMIPAVFFDATVVVSWVFVVPQHFGALDALTFAFPFFAGELS